MAKNKGQRIHEAALEEFFHGSNRDVDTAAEQLVVASTPLERGVQIKAAAGNSGVLYVGKANTVTADAADATDGFPLAAGESLFVPVDDANKIWLIGSQANQKAFWFGV